MLGLENFITNKIQNMKPFDLEKALAGEPVVTRDGRVVKELIRFKTLNDWSVFAVVGNCVIQCNDNGQHSDCEHNSLDLFMAEKPKVKKEGWVNLYVFDGIIKVGSQIFHFEHDAKFHQQLHDVIKYLPPVKIEWEEEAE
jgi:hypothetical protein